MPALLYACRELKTVIKTQALEYYDLKVRLLLTLSNFENLQTIRSQTHLGIRAWPLELLRRSLGECTAFLYHLETRRVPLSLVRAAQA